MFKKMRQFINVNVVLRDKILKDAVVAFDSDGIIYVGNEVIGGVEKIDGENGYLMAGFVDIHCHGGGGFDFMDASAEEMRSISRFHLVHGTTTLIPTTMTDCRDNIVACLDALKSLYSGGDQLTLCSAHLEGPWLSPQQCGAQSPNKMAEPSVNEMKKLITKYPFIKRISVAPELKNAFEVGKFGAENGIVMSIAHTDADFDTTISAIDNGYTLMTHLYSGMRGVIRRNAYRIAGAVEAGLYDDRVKVEIIADGKHLPTGLLKLIYKCKGADKICLVTDAMRAAGMPEGEKSVLGRLDGGLPVIVDDGVAKTLDKQGFAGSVATTDRLFKTMIGVGIDVVSVSKMASLVPSEIMGLKDRGSIEEGKRADMVLTNERFEVKTVVWGGKIVEYEIK